MAAPLPSGWTPATYYPALIAFTLGLLTVDAVSPWPWVQFALAGVTFWLLFAVLRLSPPHERAELWGTVLVSLAIEVFATQGWGLYGYRFGNVPPYVPPGHGLIFLVCTGVSRAGWMQRHGRTFVRGVFALATVWGAAALVLPLLRGGTPDVHGALYWPFFGTLMTFSKRAGAHAWTFLVASALELVGTALGTWHWTAVMPGLGLPAADPPSCVAGGYCFFAVLGVGASELVQRLRQPRAPEGALVQ